MTAEVTPHEEMKKAGIDACLVQPLSRADLYKVVYEEMPGHMTAQIHITGGAYESRGFGKGASQ